MTENNAAQPGLNDGAIQALWDEACKDSPQSPGWNRHIRFARAIESALLPKLRAPVAGEAQPTDEQIHRLAFDAGVVFGNTEEGAECWEFESPSLREFALALLSRHAAPQASEAVRSEQDVSGRTPTDYALEFAEYLARDAEYAMACLNASQRANEALLDLTEEVASSEAYQAAEEAAAEADEAFTEAITGLRSAAFEFRKRRDRAALSAQPSGNPGELAAQPGAQRTGGSDA